MASVVANEFSEATTAVYRSSLMEVGLLLLVITLLINGGAAPRVARGLRNVVTERLA